MPPKSAPNRRTWVANKNARILWALMTREVNYDARHAPVKPAAKVKQPAEPQPA